MGNREWGIVGMGNDGTGGGGGGKTWWGAVGGGLPPRFPIPDCRFPITRPPSAVLLPPALQWSCPFTTPIYLLRQSVVFFPNRNQAVQARASWAAPGRRFRSGGQVGMARRGGCNSPRRLQNARKENRPRAGSSQSRRCNTSRYEEPVVWHRACLGTGQTHAGNLLSSDRARDQPIQEDQHRCVSPLRRASL